MGNKLDVAALCTHPMLIRLEQELRELAPALNRTKFHDEKLVSKRMAAKLNSEWLCRYPRSKRLHLSLADLDGRPCAMNSLASVWHRPFDSENFDVDLEYLASSLVGKVTKIRDHQVVAQSALSGETTTIYPSAEQVKKNLPIVADMFAQPVSVQMPFLSSCLSLMYFYRLHPLPDGNGRTSRALASIALRNYGVLDSPRLPISPVFFRCLPTIGTLIRTQPQSTKLYEAMLTVYLETAKIILN